MSTINCLCFPDKCPTGTCKELGVGSQMKETHPEIIDTSYIPSRGHYIANENPTSANPVES